MQHIIGMRLKDNMAVERYLRRRLTFSQEELDFPEFPFLDYTLDFRYFWEDQTPWHWHRALELVRVVSGRICLRTNKTCRTLDPGDVCYISPQTLRRIAPEPLHSGAVCELDLFVMPGGTPQAAALGEHLARARQLNREKPFGYQLDIRSEVSDAWKILFREMQPGLAPPDPGSHRSEKRLQTMLSFILKNYASDISLADIAAAATVSERECFRCFQEILGITPTHYLQHHRIRMAVRRLLETDDSVQAISEAVGFRDSSYFGRVFQKIMHCTPSAFRRDHKPSGA